MPSGSGRRGGGDLPTGGQPRLLEFTSGSCAACARMAPIVNQVERRCLAEADGSLVHVNIDEPEGEALAERYEVRALPTFVGIDAEGAEVLRMVGVQTQEKLASAIGEVRGRACPPI
ncbi:thioredoxin family protein [Polyangium fumosum]|nr:thioredoxin family protein [Polyangium fumosum]